MAQLKILALSLLLMWFCSIRALRWMKRYSAFSVEEHDTRPAKHANARTRFWICAIAGSVFLCMGLVLLNLLMPNLLS